MNTNADSHSFAGGDASALLSTDGALCRQIELDLSAMIDGELEAASVRRVMVHSDVCPSCRGFLEGIRMQLRAHRDISSSLFADVCSGDVAFGDSVDAARVDALREELLRNRDQLARILYEMGRGYVLMGLSPSFSRVVAREPVPIPDMYMCGQNLLDEISRLASGSDGVEWVRARELFAGGELATAPENMAKGKRLLNEALALHPDFHEARIYLGHAYHVSEERDLARREFRRVLLSSNEPVMRAFALENLGNVYLEEERAEESIPYFLQVVDSGVIATEPRFYTIYFNLALAHGLLHQFADCRGWLRRLYDEFPHKRRIVRVELGKRQRFLNVLETQSDLCQDFAAAFPAWFPVVEAC